MKKLSILIASLATAACVTVYAPSYRFNEIQVVNLSGGIIEDVDLRVIDSPRTLSCEKVAPNAICYDLFGGRNYPQRGLALSWTQADGSRKTETLNPDVPAFFATAFSLRVVMEIRQDGSVNAFYEQEEPGRNGGGLFISS